MIFLILLTFLSVSATISAKENFDKEEFLALQKCFYDIVCEAKKPLDIRRFVVLSPEELQRKGYKWVEEEMDINGEDTPEFWQNYPEYQCSVTKEMREKTFKRWLRRLSEYWTNVCMEAESEKCKQMLLAEQEAQTVIAENYKDGVCKFKSQELVEKITKSGDMKNQQKSMMNMMG